MDESVASQQESTKSLTVITMHSREESARIDNAPKLAEISLLVQTTTTQEQAHIDEKISSKSANETTMVLNPYNQAKLDAIKETRRNGTCMPYHLA